MLKHSMQYFLYTLALFGRITAFRGFQSSTTFSQRSYLTKINCAASELVISIDERTTTCLDFQAILDSIKKNCVTVLGSEMSNSKFYETPQEINFAYAMIDEMSLNLDYIPLRNSMDASTVLKSIEIGSSPEKEDLAKFSETIEEIDQLRIFLEENVNTLSLYTNLSQAMLLPQELIEQFQEAFEDDYQLNGKKFPTIGQLRQQSETLKARIIQTIQNILRSSAFKEKIADSGFMEIEGRYCLMLYNTYKKGVGIVHGTSNTGRTVYVEPMERCKDRTFDLERTEGALERERSPLDNRYGAVLAVSSVIGTFVIVEPTNDLKAAQDALKAEENK
eukprot:gene12959-27346_t